MKRLACIVLALSSATLLCCPMDPVAEKRWRSAKPRLGRTQWAKCCATVQKTYECNVPLSRARALELLPDADGACLDHVLEIIKDHAPEELSAAYLIRAERNENPIDYLRALDAAKTPFNRALAQERLGLKAAAIQSWDEVVKANEPGWAAEAKEHRDRLMQPDPGELWSTDQLEAALRRRDAAAVQRLVKAFPLDTMRYFEESDLLNIETSRMFAKAFKDPYPRDIVDAAQRTTDRNALEQGLRAFRQARAFQKGGDRARASRAFERAATLLERAGNPLFLGARYEMAATGVPSLPLLDTVATTAEKHGYHDIAGRAHALRGSALDWSSRYLDAQAAYARALEFTKDEPATMVAALTRRSLNQSTLGHAEAAFRDFMDARKDLPRIADLNAVHNAYGAAAKAASNLGYLGIALQYQHAAVNASRRAVDKAPSNALHKPKQHLAVALRARANLYVELGDDERAERDLAEAEALAKAADPSLQSLLRMRLEEVRGQLVLKTSPGAAMRRFDEAIALAREQDSTYRAVLYHQRAVARRRAGYSGAEADIASALEILRAEATRLLDERERGDFEDLWPPYFARFQFVYQDMITSRIGRGDNEGAFIYAEETRAFEPMDLLLRAKPIPPPFEKVESVEDLHRTRATLPEDTVILQYLVLKDKTYTWAISRDRFALFLQPSTKSKIERWIDEIHDAVEAGQSFQTPMRAAFRELFAEPLVGFRHPRIVIIPDGPMHGLPFAALQRPDGTYLIEHASIAVAGSTSLYLYARARDRELASQCNPRVVIVGEPKIDPRRKLDPLPYAVEEAQQLARDYPGAKVLLGAEATTGNFLAAAKDATIIHFAGHAVADPHNPWMSRLMLAPDEEDEGGLTAEKLLKQLPDLAHTRFIALSACSTASGQAIGPEGLAPLVRPLIAARVPAVVGTLWDVRDATTKNLLVSLHRHYRNGDDVAVALQNAQLDMLRRNVPARLWAPFQVVGYAGSPYERPAANGGTRSERVCAENSLYRPDGLHPQ